MTSIRIAHGTLLSRWLVIALLVLSGPARSAIATGAFDGPDSFVVPAAAFNPDGNPGSDYFFSFGGGYLNQAGASTSCFMAPVYLPNGARLASMKVSAYDSNVSLNFTVEMRRTPFLTTAPTEIMALASTTGSSGLQLPEDSTVSFNKIDNRTYGYQLVTCLSGNAGSSLRIYAVTIDAELFVFGDGFESGDLFEWTTQQPPP